MSRSTPEICLDEMWGESEETQDVLSMYKNFEIGHDLLTPASKPVSLKYNNQNLKNVVYSQSQLSSVVGERNVIGCGRVQNEVTLNDKGTGSCVVREMESFLSQPSVFIHPSHEMQLYANDDMENNICGLSSEDVENEFGSYSNVCGTNSSDVKFMPVQCEKKKNPPYLLDGINITTKNGAPVKFCLKGARAGQEAQITLRYADPIKKDHPVIVCKEHRSDDTSRDPEHDCTFWITSDDCKYENLNGHCTAVIPIKEACSDMKFCMVFKCLNSCHRNHAKKIDLLMTVVDPASPNTESKSQQFNIRVCKNVKRDHKDRKRSSEETFDEFQLPVKSVKQEPTMRPFNEQFGSSPHMMEVNSASSGKLFKMLLTPKDEKEILPILKRLNIPVCPYEGDLFIQDPVHTGLTSDTEY